MNKNFHAMTTYYNIVYNGNLALEKGKQQVEDAYKEDYWAVLPIERMAIKETPSRRTGRNSEASQNTPFQEAEEKATKAIQKHSMFIKGKEYNPQIDETFLLLGKARYFDQRFIPAKDAFSFILNHYPESSTINEAVIWQEKTNLRLENFDRAIKNLDSLLKTSGLSALEQHEASATLAQAYIFEDEKRFAIPPLRLAIATAPDEEKKARLLFIKGQLYALLGEKDSARVSFDEVIALNRKSPRRYRIHSKLEQLRLKDLEKTSWNETELAFQDMAENRENRPFLDFIYYDNAVFRLAKDSVRLAVEKFNASLREEPSDTYLKSRNYFNLGEIYFDKASYETAGKYYDSTLTNLPENTLEHIQIKRKKDNLEEVINYERIAKETDSILNLVNASDEKRIQVFSAYIEKLKEEEKSVFARESASKLADSRFGAQRSQIGAQGNNPSDFYFYDRIEAQKGEVVFRRIWGDIQLTDDWRRDPVRSSGLNIESEEAVVVEEELKPEYNPQTYIAKIPTDEAIIDSISDERNFANYQLGILYKEKFRRNDLAILKLEALLENDPEERLVLPSTYYLYKIYEETGDVKRAMQWKTEILNKHPESSYASILRNPEAYRTAADNPQNIYNKLFRDYQAEHYEGVLNEIETYTKVFLGNSILPKLELLKARVLAKLEGLEAYMEALNYVALTYPQSKEGKYAQEQYKQLKDSSFSSEFDMDPAPDSEYMLVFKFDTKATPESKIHGIKEDLLAALQKEPGLNLSLNENNYTPNQTLITLKGLRSKAAAEELAEKFIKNAIIDKNFTYFVITQQNYKIAQRHKNLDDYLENYR
nr:hypothetical protein [Psychroflexus aurantiacus]